MESVLVKILEASPIAGAMIALVYMFLGALDKRDGRLKEIHDDFKGVVERNTTALIGFNATIEHCRDHTKD
jgi:hypothetical protein